MGSRIYRILLLFLFLADLKRTVFSQTEVYFFKQVNCQGDVIRWHGETPNLPADWDNKVVSIQLRGSWILYENKDFNAQQNGLVEYYFINEMITQCRNLGEIKKKVTSARYASDLYDPERPRVDMYEFAKFQGPMKFALGNTNTNMENVQSIVLAGWDPWTFYSQKGYEGKTMCVHPEIAGNYHPRFISDLQARTLPFDFPAKSIKKGCHSQRVQSLSHRLASFYDLFMRRM